MAYQQLSLDHVTIAATGFKGPEGVTVDREGNIYGGGADGVIRKLAPDGKVTEFARTGGRRPAWPWIGRGICSSVMSVRPPCSRSLQAEESVYLQIRLET